MTRSVSPSRLADGVTALATAITLVCAAPGAARAETDTAAPWLHDRGPGIATSLFGTYVARGELLAYPFYEYTRNADAEYDPEELGYVVPSDFRALNTEHEALVFLGYGVSDAIVLELESALWTTQTQHKAPDDPSAFPPELTESGFGDAQAELRWRWGKETASRPEIFSYTEVVFPFQKDRVLIGTHDWEIVQGFGLIKGMRAGTFTGRISATYDAGESSLAFGEYAVEYLKRASDALRFVLAVEGEQDEVALIGEAQVKLASRTTLKLNTGVGLTSKAPEFAPEVGVAFSFP